MSVPDSHPRKASLDVRHKLIEGFKTGLVTDAGLIAHGRGEAFDYLLGEQTTRWADQAEHAAAAMLLLAEHPVISVNGNAAALVPGETIILAQKTGAKIEVNLFYRSTGREEKIRRALEDAGAEKVYGTGKTGELAGTDSERRHIDDAIALADVVLVSLEDGDRTKALKDAGKKVIAVDLNPLSRTPQNADISIVDNIIRAFPKMIGHVDELAGLDDDALSAIVDGFDNKQNLKSVEDAIRAGFN